MVRWVGMQCVVVVFPDHTHQSELPWPILRNSVESDQGCTSRIYLMVFPDHTHQSELPRPILRNSVESDQGCTSRIYFDNASENVTLTLYNVMLTPKKSC